MTRSGLIGVVGRVGAVVPPGAQVKVGVEAAGHYHRSVAERLVSAAKEALPTRDAAVARRVLATDVELLADLDTQISAADAELATLVPLSPFATSTSVPGGGVMRVSNYAASLGDPGRWPGPRQIYPTSTTHPARAC